MTDSTKPKSATKAKPASKKTATAKTKASKSSSEKSNATKAGAKIQTGRLAGARSAVNLPIEAVLGAANRVGSLVSPVTDRVSGDQKVAEGLKNFGDRAEKIQIDLTKALESQVVRAQELVGQARGRLSNLRP